MIVAGGPLAPWQALRCRVRYFSQGAVLGSCEWVDGFFTANRALFGPKREGGARTLRHVTLRGVFSLRDLRLGVVG